MATEQLAPGAVATPIPEHDAMPVHGIDHVELYVGNAAQAAFFATGKAAGTSFFMGSAVRAAGSVSANVVPVAAFGPALLTTIVYVTVPPAVTLAALSVLVTVMKSVPVIRRVEVSVVLIDCSLR